MDNRAEIRDFLVTRRVKLRPEDTGLPDFGGMRWVPGLRREEVALLAGVSVERATPGGSPGASKPVAPSGRHEIARVGSVLDAEQDSSEASAPTTAGLRQR